MKLKRMNLMNKTHLRKHLAMEIPFCPMLPCQRASNVESVCMSWRHQYLPFWARQRWVSTVSPVSIDYTWSIGDNDRLLPVAEVVILYEWNVMWNMQNELEVILRFWMPEMPEKSYTIISKHSNSIFKPINKRIVIYGDIHILLFWFLIPCGGVISCKIDFWLGLFD